MYQLTILASQHASLGFSWLWCFFKNFPGFWWLWQCWRVLNRYFEECPSVGICIFFLNYYSGYVFLERWLWRQEVSFSWSHIKIILTQLTAFHLSHLNEIVGQVSALWVTLSPPCHTVFFKRKSLYAAHIKEWRLMLLTP